MVDIASTASARFSSTCTSSKQENKFYWTWDDNIETNFILLSQTFHWISSLFERGCRFHFMCKHWYTTASCMLCSQPAASSGISPETKRREAILNSGGKMAWFGQQLHWPVYKCHRSCPDLVKLQVWDLALMSSSSSSVAEDLSGAMISYV